ncbi:aminopeptidase P family protein [Acidiphilium sp.]|uniref:aminopeptidase P family protein n=1 Tax=Acidiphilium sp. TaxID=527 RepID=UPI00258B0B89|nr:aminopeptidase P family protein [Acidiphilium sp.]
MMKTQIGSLRNTLRAEGLDGFIQPRSDEFLGEYVPASAARLAWLTGFTGSAGLAILLADRAAVFSDGRYTLQLAEQTDPAIWERHHIVETPPVEWLQAAAPGAQIGYDPWLMTANAVAAYADAGLTMVPVANPIDALWADRPAPPASPALAHPPEHAGESAASKRARIAETIAQEGADAVLLTDPHAVAWLFNLRGADLPHTPTVLCFALLRRDASAIIFIDPARVPPATRAHLGAGVEIVPRAAMAQSLAALRGQRVRLDPATAPIHFSQLLGDAGAITVSGGDPCVLPRAIKNPVEQEGARVAHRHDGVALCRFLAWFAAASPEGGQTERSAAAQLLACRSAAPGFHGESFPAISGAGEHGAIIHYSVTPASDRPIRRNEIYLIDSGGQYPDGTTDVTRTLWTGPGAPPQKLRDHFTRVLAGHIALARARFPQGTTGPQLDALARAPLWEAGLDFDHGTGHGVGSYLSVHEGPVSFHRLGKPIALAPGMILSDEPGYYEPGGYGIRLENLLLVVPSPVGAAKPFLEFEPLTLAPFDRRLIDPALLAPAARDWLDAYHARVLATIGPALDAAARAWLEAACAKL